MQNSFPGNFKLDKWLVVNITWMILTDTHVFKNFYGTDISLKKNECPVIIKAGSEILFQDHNVLIQKFNLIVLIYSIYLSNHASK